MPLPDRIAAGLTWPPLRLASCDGDRLRLRAASRGALHDGITPGDAVVVAPVSAPDRGLPGRCVGVEDDTAELRMSPLPEPLPGWLEGGHVAVSRAIDETTMRRYQAALRAADRASSPLKDALLEAEVDAIPARESSTGQLNAPQRRAVAAALDADPLALIHGPPGTGKTHVMVAALQALVAQGERPWALADSNAAVDALAVRADEAGLSVLRMGSPWRIGPATAHLSLHARAKQSPLAPALRVLEVAIRRAQGREKRTLSAERRSLLRQIRAQLISRCDVLAATLGTMVRLAPELGPSTIAIIDEATQAIEPAVWGVVPHIARLVLIGDPHQLGPVTRQPGSLLERSLLTRLLEAGIAAPMLEVQYRMSRALGALVAPIYGPSWRPDPSVAEQRLADLPGVRATPLTEAAAIWVDTAGSGLGEVRDPVSMSLYNEGEIELIVQAAARLLDAGVSDIGIIAPYSAQVARLRERLPDLEVATVNAFQGREKEAILCSLVRSNMDGELGFVADRRRMVVSMSRARRLLVCVGDSATLSRSPDLAGLMERIQAVGQWQSVWEPPWDAALD